MVNEKLDYKSAILRDSMIILSGLGFLLMIIITPLAFLLS
jgi:hypothetical protein